jgi:hypothetical protein
LLAPERVELTPTNAVIHWITDVPTATRVQVNPDPAKVVVADRHHTTTNHTATINGLRAGVHYEVKLGTGRMWLATNRFTATGTPVAEESVQTISPAARPAKSPPEEAPPTRKTWGNLSSLPDHFQRHGTDFHAKDADDYARKAWEFLQRARAEGLPAKVDEDGVLRVFDPSSHTFAAYNRNGTTKTFFKVRSRDYFNRQPGRPIDLKTGK